jgi:hypothetical protein
MGTTIRQLNRHFDSRAATGRDKGFPRTRDRGKEDRKSTGR